MRRRLCFLAALCFSLGSGLAYADVERDTDRDGLSDRIERSTGTNPLRADTDEDGVADGVEDRDRDGVHDPTESDPRRSGLFPGTSPHIPEPLGFDLVRGLGARRGEVEVNTLAIFDSGKRELAWAPELEWAFADGYAVELELPLVDRHLKAVKVGLQGTLPALSSSIAHGWQAIGEVPLEGGAQSGSLLYLFGQRPSSKISYLVMAGARGHFGGSGLTEPGGLLNASLFWDQHESQTFGLETNFSFSEAHWSVRMLPQLHVQVSRRLRIQLAAGLEFREERAAPLAATRMILE